MCGTSGGGQYGMVRLPTLKFPCYLRVLSWFIFQVANLFGRYDVVPQAIFPESFASSTSGRMRTLLRTNICEHGIAVGRFRAALRSSHEISSLAYEAANTALASVRRRDSSCKEHTVSSLLPLVFICYPTARSHKSARQEQKGALVDGYCTP